MFVVRGSAPCFAFVGAEGDADDVVAVFEGGV